MPIFATSLIRGETFSLALEAVEGDVAGATVSADVKQALNGQPPPDDAEVLASFTVAPASPVAPGGGPGWILTLTAQQTEALPPRCVTDARVVLANGFVDQVDPVEITVRNRVTG